MSAERVNPFADEAAAPSFAPKPRTQKPVEPAQIERLSRDNNFPSRQAAHGLDAMPRKRRVYKTGRNQQLNIKATAATIERFYGMADKREVPLGELLELALDALERGEGGA